jgi:quercetin dioxygenase-like cupin family protein
MTSTKQAFIRTFAEGEAYTQPEPAGAAFRSLLKRDEVPGLSMGLVTLEGPIHKTPGSHPDWEQVYLVLAGSATVHLPDGDRKIGPQSLVVIPRNTRHSMECAAGERVEYVYINQYR